MKTKEFLLKHLKVIIMGTLKFISLSYFMLLFTSCHEIKYYKSNDSFQSIYLREWNSSNCPKKVILERYTKNTNFKNLIDSNFDFDINSDCFPKYDKFNKKVASSTYNDQLILTPYVPYTGQIDYDIKLIIDDSILYKITNIISKIDTVYANGRSFIIMNNITSLVVNGHKLDNTNGPLNIDIPTKIGKFIKRYKE